MLRRKPLLVAAMALFGCGSSPVADEAAFSTELEPRANWRDIRSVALSVDLAAKQARAVIELEESTEPGASLEVGALALAAVSGEHGPVAHRVEGKRLDLGLAAQRPARHVGERDDVPHEPLLELGQAVDPAQDLARHVARAVDDHPPVLAPLPEPVVGGVRAEDEDEAERDADERVRRPRQRREPPSHVEERDDARPHRDEEQSS